VETPGEVALTWRPLTATDLPLLTQWLREPLVARWWNHDTTAEAVQRDFGPSVRGEEPGEDLVILVDDERIGLLQRSVIRDYPEDFTEFAAIVDVPDGAAELDYLIGDAARRGRGLGPGSCWPRHVKKGPGLPAEGMRGASNGRRCAPPGRRYRGHHRCRG